MPRPDPRRSAPGMRSTYGGTIVDRGSTDPLRVIPTTCGRCQGYGRVGEELFCPVCQGARFDNPQDAYEPYYESSVGMRRSSLPASRTFADRSQHPAHNTQNASGVKVRSAGRK